MLIKNKNSTIQQWEYLNNLYQSPPASLGEGSHSVPETNGEILYPSVEKLMTLMALTNHDIFLDLGSGKGKIVLQVFLNSSVQAVYGIELRSDLHQQAILAANKLREHPHPDMTRSMTFLQGNFLTMPLPPATIILINSTCFSQAMLYTLGKIINQMKSVRMVFTSRPINTLERLCFKKAVYMECSWDTALCYVYA